MSDKKQLFLALFPTHLELFQYAPGLFQLTVNGTAKMCPFRYPEIIAPEEEEEKPNQPAAPSNLTLPAGAAPPPQPTPPPSRPKNMRVPIQRDKACLSSCMHCELKFKKASDYEKTGIYNVDVAITCSGALVQGVYKYQSPPDVTVVGPIPEEKPDGQ